MPLIATVMLNPTGSKETNKNNDIVIDDVIEAHKFLKKFDGDFKKLFKDIAND